MSFEDLIVVLSHIFQHMDDLFDVLIESGGENSQKNKPHISPAINSITKPFSVVPQKSHLYPDRIRLWTNFTPWRPTSPPCPSTQCCHVLLRRYMWPVHPTKPMCLHSAWWPWLPITSWRLFWRMQNRGPWDWWRSLKTSFWSDHTPRWTPQIWPSQTRRPPPFKYPVSITWSGWTLRSPVLLVSPLQTQSFRQISWIPLICRYTGNELTMVRLL